MSSPGPGTPVKELGVATHRRAASPALERGRHSGHAHRLCPPPLLLFSPPLCSGGSDSCYQGRLFTLCISQ